MANASEPIGQQSASPTKLRNLYVDTAYVTNHNQWAVMTSTAPTFARFRAASTASCRALSCRDGEQAVDRPQVAAAPLDAVAHHHHQPRHTRGAWGREGARARRRRSSGLASRERFRRSYCSSPSRSRIKSSGASSPPTGILGVSVADLLVATPLHHPPHDSCGEVALHAAAGHVFAQCATPACSPTRRGGRGRGAHRGRPPRERGGADMTDLAAAHWAGLLGGPQEATRVPTQGRVGVGGRAARAPRSARRTGCGMWYNCSN
ncbi:hypothetical protein PAHAL_1G296400 [Panicum hallii]|jgi:hypothetical protein|uniref:Uncharacterized protein n=1 Tax=Panicum hallii TaxID=206008 RepID=A0A2S3GQN9_9POAL|nr:hypothetical protein PAHAL_1G296400 [Panicum hallii]